MPVLPTMQVFRQTTTESSHQVRQKPVLRAVQMNNRSCADHLISTKKP